MTTLYDKPIPIPSIVDFKSSPTEVLTYMTAMPILNVDTWFISEYIDFKTPNNPDDEDVYDSCVLGDLEIRCATAEEAQWQFENEMEAAINNEEHPRHSEAIAYYN